MAKNQKARKMMEYRLEKKAELSRLHETIASLESMKRNMMAKAPRTLLWEDVATALAEDRRLAQCQQRNLRKQLVKQGQLAKEMYAWVVANKSLNTNTLTWRHVSLASNPTTRGLGKEWITKQMYHNTERFMLENGLPPFESDYWFDCPRSAHFQFDDDDGHYTLVATHYGKRRGEMKKYIDAMHSILLFELGVVEYTQIMYQAHENTYQYVSSNEEHVNLLVGIFLAADQCVAVVQHIHDDEMNPSTRRYRNRSAWVVTDQVKGDSSSFTYRIVACATQSMTPKGEFAPPLEVDAADFKVDLSSCPHHLKAQRFPNLYKSARYQAMKELRPVQWQFPPGVAKPWETSPPSHD
ncbi:hypothetical protein AC1031_010231 [Aphanomyces cochlioides]|nr:hypothetical protein AC1031_010231 [Aphanomyces cochlioides]